MSAEEDAAARRAAWIAAGAPDYNAPTKDSSGNITGYVSVAAEPQSARSESNQGLQIVGNQVVDTKTGQSGPYFAAQGTVTWINQAPQPVQQPIQQPTQQPTQPNPTPSPGDALVTTCKGQMTRNFLHDQLYQAGYDGPWDTASMVAAFNRAACPSIGDRTTSGGGSGGGTAGGGGGSTGGSSETGTPVNLVKAGTMSNLQGWIQANPIPAILLAAVAGSMLLGSGRRR